MFFTNLKKINAFLTKKLSYDSHRIAFDAKMKFINNFFLINVCEQINFL